MSLQTPGQKMAAMYRSYGQGNAEPLFDLMADDGVFRFVTPEKSFDFAGSYLGADGVRDAISAIVGQYRWLRYDNLEMIAEGDLVVAVNGGRIGHLASGRESDVHLADLIRFKDGKIAEFIEFFDSAGLRDWGEGNGEPCTDFVNRAHGDPVTAPGDAERNKAALVDVYAAYDRGEAEPLLALLADDASYNSIARCNDFVFAGPFRGRDAWIENLGRIAETYTLEYYRAKAMIAENDLVAVHADTLFTRRSDGHPMKTEKIDLFRMKDGRIVEFNEFFDTEACR